MLYGLGFIAFFLIQAFLNFVTGLGTMVNLVTTLPRWLSQPAFEQAIICFESAPWVCMVGLIEYFKLCAGNRVLDFPG
jgi:hypothetical protein